VEDPKSEGILRNLKTWRLKGVKNLLHRFWRQPARSYCPKVKEKARPIGQETR